jgi:hypothetical protein
MIILLQVLITVACDCVSKLLHPGHHDSYPSSPALSDISSVRAQGGGDIWQPVECSRNIEKSVDHAV